MPIPIQYLLSFLNRYSDAGYQTDGLVKQEADYSRVCTGGSLYRKRVFKTVRALKGLYKPSSVDNRSGAIISADFVSRNYIQLPHYIMIEKYRIIQRTFM